MKSKSRLIALFAALLLLVSVFAGCGGTEDPAQTTSSATTSTQTTTTGGTVATEPGTTADPFDLSTSSSWDSAKWLEYEKTLDFDGRTFSLMSSDPEWRHPDEGATSELMVQWQKELDQLEKDLNITLEFLQGDFHGGVEPIYTWLVAGDSLADVYEIKTHTFMPLVIKGYVVPWDDERIQAAGLDINNELFFYQPFTQAWKTNGHIYGARSAGKYRPPEAGWVMFFNKPLVNDAGVSDIYQLVREGKWDWDSFLDIAGRAQRDTDNDGTPDYWGLGTGYLGYGEEVYLAGGKIVDWVDGKLTSTIDSAAARNAFEFMTRVANSGFIVQSLEGEEGLANATYKGAHVAFREGKVAFLWSELSRSSYLNKGGSTSIQDSDMDWGILPLPKMPGGEYMNILGGVTFDLMMTTNKNIEESAMIYAAFARRDNDVEWKDYLDLYTQDGDDGSLEMLSEYIYPNTVANWSWVSVDHNDTYRAEIVYKIFDENASYSALIEAVKPKLQNLLDSLGGQ